MSNEWRTRASGLIARLGRAGRPVSGVGGRPESPDHRVSPRAGCAPQRKRGFTLVELVVVVAIVGILASAAYPLAELVSRRSKEAELRHALREIRSAIDSYKKAADEQKIPKAADASGYPKSLEELADGVRDPSKPDESRIYFLRRLPRDPFARDRSVPAAQTWGLRSYKSPPDNPRPGDDVFDVYSLSPETGLNGVPYREW